MGCLMGRSLTRGGIQQNRQQASWPGHVLMFQAAVAFSASSTVTIEVYLLKYVHDSGYLKGGDFE